MNNNNGSLSFQASIDINQLKRDMLLMKKEFVGMSNSAKLEGSKTQSVMNGLMKGAAAYFSIRQATQFAQQIVSIRGEFQQLSVAFETMLGNKEKSDQLMSEVVDFAAKTPFKLTEVAGGTKQLLAYRVEQEKIIPTLKALGDVSAGLNVPINRLILNYGQVKTAAKLTGRELRDFNMAGVPLIAELSKNLNKSETDISTMVSAGRIGFKDVEEAFRTMTSAGGSFENLMEKQSSTITGRISNLNDAIDVMYNNIGTSNEGIINGAIDGANYLVENYEEVGRQIGGLVVAFGAYRAALIVTSAVQGIVTASTVGMTAAEVAHYYALVLSEKAQKALNLTTLKNPYVLAAAALATLVYVMYQFATAQTLAERAQGNFNDKMQERIDLAEEERGAIKENIGVLNDETKTRLDKQEALGNLQKLYPKYFDNLDIEKAKYVDLKDALKKFNEELEVKNKLSDQDKLNSLREELANVDKNPENVSKINSAIRSSQFSSGNFSAGIANLLGAGDVELDDYKEKLENKIKLYEDKLSKQEQLKFDSLSKIEKIEQKNNENKEYQKQLDGLGEVKENEIGINKIIRDSIKENIKNNNIAIEKIKLSKDETESLRSESDVLKDIAAKKIEINNLESKFKATGLSDAQKVTLSDYNKELDGLKDELEANSGKKPKAIKEKESNYDSAKVALENNRKLEDEKYKSSLRQIEIDKEGSEKSIEILRLENERKLVLLNRQKADAISGLEDDAKEDAKENPNSTIDWDAKISEFSDVWDKTIIQQGEINVKATDNFLKEQLEQYKTHEKERQSLIEESNQKIKDIEFLGTEKGSKTYYSEELKAEKERIEKVLFEFDKLSNKNIIGKLFGDTSKLNISEMKKLIDEAEKLYEDVPKTDGNVEKLKAIREQIENLKKAISETESIFSRMGDNLDELFEGGQTEQEFKKTFGEIQSDVGAVIDAVDFLGDSISSLGDSFDSQALKEIGAALGDVVSVASETMEGAKAGAAFGPVGAAIGATIGLVSSIAKVFSRRNDEKKEAEIQKLQNQLEGLEKTYAKLSKSIDKAYSSSAAELIRENDKVLKQQKDIIKAQIIAEQGKKKPDKNKIKAWENAISDIEETLEESESKQIEAINGKSVQQAISEFSDAYVAAWSAGEDKAAAMKDVVRNMVKSAISELVKSRMSGEVEAFSNYLAKAMEDGILTVAEKNVLDSLEATIANKMNGLSETLDDYVVDEVAVRKASESGFSKMSQDSADELNGRFAAMQTHTFMISESIKTLQLNSSMQLKHLAGIETNTASLSRLEKIENDIYSVKSGIEEINDKGIKVRR
ncbi:tape measure protein [Polaribacter sp. IC073]|uniref:tape measure protein n=1 Tax=Polaribacter sp. IC073 TaxID=2508540 RepID=UPI001679C591|nr:tape measure protein [Polaribacter sp. IC073]